MYEEELGAGFEKIRNIVETLTEMRNETEQESEVEIIEEVIDKELKSKVNPYEENIIITPDEEEEIFVLDSPPHPSPPLPPTLTALQRSRQKTKKSVTGYKQYTRRDILAALEEVRKGRSALQVSKQFNIPSRTLYDKARKMGITSGRSRRNRRKVVHNQEFQDLNEFHSQILLQKILSENNIEDIFKIVG